MVIAGTRQWDKTLIYTLMPQWYDKTMQLPLLDEFEEDKRIWKFSTDGLYSVKSTYRLVMYQFGDQHQFQIPGNWMAIWRLNVPQKIKVFLWRVCMDCIPTRIRLQSRGIECPASCLFCQRNLENAFHYFFTCPGSISVWEREGLWHMIEPCLTVVE